MGFPTPLSGANVTKITSDVYSATPSLLKNPNDVVFSAQVNQTLFTSPFASVTFDNVSGGTDIADVLDGFSVYIGETTNIREARFVGRARGDGAAGTTLNINETDVNLEDDFYITVVKDVGIKEILGKYVNNVMTMDWDKPFRALLPRVTELQSAYAKKLASGIADFTFPAVGLPTTLAATIASWLWLPDGGSFINGTSNTDAQPDIRYSSPGVYWPRVYVTDSNGLVNWFTMPVFVMSADMSDDFIVNGIDKLTISFPLGTGNEMQFTLLTDQMDDTLERTLVVLYNEDNYDGDKTPIISSIKFVGRLRRETLQETVLAVAGKSSETPFVCEGILGQLGRIRSPKMGMTFAATPSEFGQINRMTQWRMASFILTEFSTVANVCSLSFSEDGVDTHLNKEDSTEDQGLLIAVNGLLSARKGALNLSAQGELYGARNAVFLPDTDRDLLDEIYTFTNNDALRAETPRDVVASVGQIEGYGGGYSAIDGSLQVIRASAPAIASNEAQGAGSPVSGILLVTDATTIERQAEMGQIVADALADANPKDTPRMLVRDGYHFLTPTNFQWYGDAVTDGDNNRGVSYTAADRFLLTQVDSTYDQENSGWDVNITISHETQGGDFAIISQVTPGAIPTSLPNIPSIPAYPNFPVLDSLYLPTGYDVINIPPISQGDGSIITSPVEPSAQTATAILKGSVVAHWDEERVWLTKRFTESYTPPWSEIFTAVAPMLVKDFKFDPLDDGAYVLTNDEAGNSSFWRTDDVYASEPSWAESSTTLGDIDYTTIRTTAEPGEVYIFGLDDRIPPTVVDLLDGNGRFDSIGGELVGSSQPGTHTPPITNGAGVYKEDGDYFAYRFGDNGGEACNVEYPIPARGIVNYIQFVQEWRKGPLPSSGEKDYSVSIGSDSPILGSLPATGGSPTFLGDDSGVTPLGLTGDSIVFHVSMNRTVETYVHINSIHIEMTDSGKAAPAFRRSSDYGGSLGSLKPSGGEINGASLPGYDTGAIDTTVLLGADDAVRGTDDFGLNFGNKVGTDTTGTYTKAIRAYGKTANVDTIIASDALFDTTKTMLSIENASPVDITPDDGSFPGLIVNRNCLDMSRVSDDDIWALCFFDTDKKLAISDDKGQGWGISAKAFTADANYLRVKKENTNQIYISDGSVIKYSETGGIGFETDRVAATLNVAGVEVK